MMTSLSNIFRSFLHDVRGAIAVEGALIMTVLLFMALGVLDFGLMMSRKMEITNAVRAGAQYALVRKPVTDTLDNDYDAYQDIKNATLSGLISSKRASGTLVAANLTCSCGLTASACFGSDPDPDADPGSGDDLTCDDGVLRSSYLTIRLRETYSYLFGFGGLAKEITINESATVRLN